MKEHAGLEEDMIEIRAYEAKTKLSQLLKQVKEGKRIVITKRHLPIAMFMKSYALRVEIDLYLLYKLS